MRKSVLIVKNRAKEHNVTYFLRMPPLTVLEDHLWLSDVYDDIVFKLI